MRFIVLMIIGAVFAASAAAEEAPSAEKILKAQEAYSLAVTDETLGDMAVRAGRLVAEQVNLSLAGQGKSLSEARANEMIVRFSAAFVRNMKQMEPRIITLYAKHLTDRELDLMIEMYSNPEMAEVMKKLPRVMEDMMPLIQNATPAMVTSVIQGMQADGLLNNL